MASTYSSRLRLELMASGEQSGTWGDKTNTNLGTLIEEAIAGWESIATGDANVTLTANNGSTDQARKAILKFTGALTANRNVVVPTVSKIYYIDNACTGSFSLVVKTAAGSGITVPNGTKAVLYCDGTNVVDAVNWLSALTLAGALSVGGAATITGTLSPLGLLDASGASAGQIKFPATQNASANVNTLDDYEEGTFTPTMSFATPGTSSWSYATQSGIYTKIGDVVIFNITLSATPTIGTGSGVMSISGFPFTSAAQQYCACGQLNSSWAWPASRTMIVGQINTSSNTFDLRGFGSGVNLTQFTAAHMTNGASHTVVLTGSIKVT